MAQKWTPEQLEAITRRGCNLLVAAGAGAGKTAVLVERIIRKITDSEKPVDIDRLLVVTFTNAAATEMRERIGDALAAALEENPGSRNLYRQMALLDRASIMTLHSFCLEVVRNNFHGLDLDPLFRIADETESMLIKLDALNELFEEKYENEDSESMFFQLVDSYGGGSNDSALRETVLTLHRFTQSHPWPEQWLTAQAEACNIGASACLTSTPWARVLLKSAAAELQGLTALLEKTAARASRGRGLEPYCSVLEEDIEKLRELLRLCEAALAAGSTAPAAECLTRTDAPAAGLDITGAVQAAQEDMENDNNPASVGIDPDTGIVAAADGQPAGSTALAAGSAASAAASGQPTGGTQPDNDQLTHTAAPGDQAWDALHRALSSVEFNRLPRCGKDADAKLQEEVKAVRNQVKEQIKKLYESGFDATAEQWKEDFAKLYPQLLYLSDMVCRFNEIFQKKKKDKGVLDFNDLEHYCLKVLLEDGVPTKAAEELSEKYDEILVDEYQDSNLVQELILETVSGKRSGRNNVFMVGDVKQSIYRFRHAKPELFMSKYQSYPRERGHDNQVIQLYKNFRSRKEILDAVNYIFGQIMSEQVGELDYTQEEYLRAGAEYEQVKPGFTAGGDIEVHIIDLDSTLNGAVPDGTQNANETGSNSQTTGSGEQSDETGEEEEELLDSIQAEARIAGMRIKSLVSRTNGSFVVYDKKLQEYRPVQYRDIVILMRATRRWADVFVDELAAMGIPAYADTDLGYFRTVEVETMLSLLKIIDNPLQDIPMLAVLRSPMFGLSTDELADIRLAARDVTIYEAIKTGTQKEGTFSADLQEKLLRFLSLLKGWRDAAKYTPTDELVWQLLTETGYYSYVGILPGGQSRQANLRMLFERARQYEETSYKGLFNFINFINRLRSGEGDMGSAKIFGENDNVVRIMSIHKSKGLEFPVVILSGCGKKFNMLDLNSDILLHQELGFGPDLVDLDRRTVTPTLLKHSIKQKLRLEMLSEEMRIMYVAFTRAREKLIITGGVRNLKGACARWCAAADTEEEKLPPFSVMKASGYLDWIGPALARHECGKPIRLAAGINENSWRILEDTSRWEVMFCGGGTAKAQKETKNPEENIRSWLEKDEQEDGAHEYEHLVEMLQWNYPYKKLSSVPVKISVTELKRRFLQEEQESAVPYVSPMVARPLFMETEKGMSAAAKGTIMHFVMQNIDLARLADVKKQQADRKEQRLEAQQKANGQIRVQEDDPAQVAGYVNMLVEEIRAQIESMVADEKLTATEADTINPEAIAAFFETPLGQRILGAKNVRRETAFNIEVNCSEIFADMAEEMYENETMLLQGVIDCWFESEDGIVLLDYKTDYVPEGGEDIIRKRYSVQIGYYAKALEKITGSRVTEKYLYLFHTGRLLRM